MSITRSCWGRQLTLAALLAVLFVGFYYRSLDDFFYLDDFVFLDRSKIESPGDLVGFFSVESNKQGLLDKDHSYRPISTNLYFGLLQHLFGPNPLYYHLSNLSLAGFNGLLLFRLLLLLRIRKSVSVATAFLYSTSSVNFSSQLWLSCSQELLLVTFTLLSFMAYLRWSRDSGLGLYFASLTLYLMALLSKETAIVLPLVLLLYQLCLRSDGVARIIKPLVPFAIMNGVYLVWRSLNFSFPDQGAYALQVGPFLFDHLFRYFMWSVEAVFIGSHALLGVAVLAVGVAILWGSSRERRRLSAFGVGWFLAFLGPVIFMPNHIYPYYAVLPAIGLLMWWASAVDSLADRLPNERQLVFALVICVAVSWLFSLDKFHRAAEYVAHSSDAFVSLVQQIETQCPEPADHSDFYFYFVLPRGFSIDNILKGRGAALRVLYDNPTLFGGVVDRNRLEQIRFRPGKKNAVFKINVNGDLTDLTPSWVRKGNRACTE